MFESVCRSGEGFGCCDGVAANGGASYGESYYLLRFIVHLLTHLIIQQQAHALTPFLTEETPPSFPFLTLLLSGGHTLLLLARSETNFKILATTQDESIGYVPLRFPLLASSRRQADLVLLPLRRPPLPLDWHSPSLHPSPLASLVSHYSASLDKASRALHIPLSLGQGSAGAALESYAFSPSSSPTPPSSSSSLPLPLREAPSFPLPFRNQLSFSYSGARSSLTRLLTAEPPEEMDEDRKKQVAVAFMKAAFEQVGEKVGLAVRGFEEEERAKEEGGGMKERLGALVVSGGVASNLYLRKRCVGVVFFSAYKGAVACSMGGLSQVSALTLSLPPIAASAPNSTPSATPPSP